MGPSAFFILRNITFFVHGFKRKTGNHFLFSKIMHPNAHKGRKSWLALHAVPHGGMTHE